MANQRLKFNTRRLTRLAVFIALALIFSYLESLLPPLLPFAPGAKMGLSNVVTLIAIIVLGSLDAAIIQVLRCTLSAFILGGVSGLMYSIPAGLASLAVMLLLYNLVFPKVSLMGISFCSAIVNNIVQLLIASLVAKTSLMLMLPFYIFASVAAGLFVGIAAYFTIKYLPKSVYAN